MSNEDDTGKPESLDAEERNNVIEVDFTATRLIRSRRLGRRTVGFVRQSLPELSVETDIAIAEGAIEVIKILRDNGHVKEGNWLEMIYRQEIKNKLSLDTISQNAVNYMAYAHSELYEQYILARDKSE